MEPQINGSIRASVVGGGSWGTAFARLLASAGVETEIICRRSEQAEAINRSHRNPDYLRDIELPASLTAVSFENSNLRSADLAVIAIPSKVYRKVVAEVAETLNPDAAVLSHT